MRKASDIVLLVGLILGFVTAGSLFIAGIVCLVLGSPIGVELLGKSMEAGNVAQEEQDVAVLAWTLSMIFSGILMMVLGVLSILSSVFAIQARKKTSKGAYITSLVFGALINEVVLVGSIFGLISCKDNKQE